MAHCNLCNKNCRCSCKGWGCPWCNSTNKQVSFMNDLLNFGVTKDLMKEKLKEIHSLTEKIDSYTAFEYLTGVIDEEKFNEAVANYKSWFKPYVPKKKESEVANFKPTHNPNTEHNFPDASAWSRCTYCNCIRKYCGKEECPMHKWEENE